MGATRGARFPSSDRAEEALRQNRRRNLTMSDSQIRETHDVPQVVPQPEWVHHATRSIKSAALLKSWLAHGA